MVDSETRARVLLKVRDRVDELLKDCKATHRKVLVDGLPEWITTPPEVEVMGRIQTKVLDEGIGVVYEVLVDWEYDVGKASKKPVTRRVVEKFLWDGSHVMPKKDMPKKGSK